MKRPTEYILSLLAGTAYWIHALTTGPAPLPPQGQIITEDPEQTAAVNISSWTYKNYTVYPLATYNIRARVLKTESYYVDRAADISPVDWVLGWREMSDSSILDKVKLIQFDRWYYWNSDGTPIPESTIAVLAPTRISLPATRSSPNACATSAWDTSFTPADIWSRSKATMDGSGPVRSAGPTPGEIPAKWFIVQKPSG